MFEVKKCTAKTFWTPTNAVLQYCERYSHSTGCSAVWVSYWTIHRMINWEILFNCRHSFQWLLKKFKFSCKCSLILSVTTELISFCSLTYCTCLTVSQACFKLLKQRFSCSSEGVILVRLIIKAWSKTTRLHAVCRMCVSHSCCCCTKQFSPWRSIKVSSYQQLTDQTSKTKTYCKSVMVHAVASLPISKYRFLSVESW